jgi:antitoxin FitA
MGDLLVRKVPEATKAALKKKAKAAGQSMNDFVREKLNSLARPSKEEAWAEADRIRAKIRARVGHDLSDSTADIRQDRDNDEPYR